MKTKIFSPVKKIKQNPKKKSPINKSLDKYREFISEKKDIPKSKNKKVIQVKRKRLSPKVKKNNIQDINDIEQKLLEIKDTKIKMPTQNIKITSEIKPRIIDKSESKYPRLFFCCIKYIISKRSFKKFEGSIPSLIISLNKSIDFFCSPLNTKLRSFKIFDLSAIPNIFLIKVSSISFSAIN